MTRSCFSQLRYQLIDLQIEIVWCSLVIRFKLCNVLAGKTEKVKSFYRNSTEIRPSHCNTTGNVYYLVPLVTYANFLLFKYVNYGFPKNYHFFFLGRYFENLYMPCFLLNFSLMLFNTLDHDNLSKVLQLSIIIISFILGVTLIHFLLFLKSVCLGLWLSFFVVVCF